jgi:hypothetical protein
MGLTPRKLSFEEAWDSITIFFVDDELEQEIDREVDHLLRLAEQYGVMEKNMSSNSRYGENRAFVNFADGGGWLARRRDFQRLVENCHYFINLRHLDLLEPIVITHVPQRYFRKTGQ